MKVCFLLLMCALPLSAAVHRVNLSDANAFHTIQDAVDAAKPGDTVEIASGVYHERVHIKNGGTAEQPLRVQGAPNGFVLINAGTKLELNWSAVEGAPQVFSARISEEALPKGAGIWEMPSRLRLVSVASMRQVAERLASWHYDRTTGHLYVRSSGRAPVPELELWVESPEEPVVKVTAPYVELRNLQATLGYHGFLFTGKTSSHGTIENCRAFCNTHAGIYITGSHHRVERNEVFENNAGGIRMLYGVSYTVVRGNTCYRNGPNNGEHTGGVADLNFHGLGDFNVFEGNTLEGIHEDTLRYKTARGSNPTNTIRHNVIRGNQTPSTAALYGNTMIVDGLGMRYGMYRNGGLPGPMRSWEAVDPEGLQRALNLIYPLAEKRDPSFADPAYRDYRLQGNSPYFGRGAHPGPAPILYVDPVNGRHENSGRSRSEPLQSVKTALERLPAGGTLYLLPGSYDEQIILNNNGGTCPEDPLRIRAYGKQPGVALLGGLQIRPGGLENKGRAFIELDGLEFHGPLHLEKATGVRVLHSLFIGEKAGIIASESPRLRVDRCTFIKNRLAIALENSPKATVVQSLFTECVQLLKGGSDTFWAYNRHDSDDDTLSGKFTKINLRKNNATPAEGPLAIAAADFGFVGARQESLTAHWEIAQLRIAGLTPHGATLLWETPRQATLAEITLEGGGIKRTWRPEQMLQILGHSFDITRMMDAFYSSLRHAVLSNLKPNTTYTVTLVPLDREGRRGNAVPLEFRTPSQQRQGVVRYISPKGDDTANGKSPQTAWKSFAHATAQLAPGDELVLLGGTYKETLRPRVSGTPGHPITFRAAKGEKVEFDLSHGLNAAVEILNVDYITVNGLLISGGSFPRSYCFLINHARGVTIRNCEVEWPKGSSFEKLKLGYFGVVAHAAPELRVENNRFVTCTAGVAASHSPGTVVQNNTIVGEGNYGVVILAGDAKESYTIENNLFYRATLGYKTNPVIWVFEPMPQLVCDHNLYYIPEDHKGTIGQLPNTERLAPLSAWVAATGLDRHSIQEKPEFTDPATRDFSLRESSPGKIGARDGGAIGWRKPE